MEGEVGRSGRAGDGGYTFIILFVVMLSLVWTHVQIVHSVRFRYTQSAVCPWNLSNAVFRKSERKKRGRVWGMRHLF